MKTLIITALIAIVAVSARAQQHLPDTIRIKLSQREYITMVQKVDSLTNLLQLTSSLPSNQVVNFNQRVNASFSPLMRQIQAQLIVDKPTSRGVIVEDKLGSGLTPVKVKKGKTKQ